MFLPRSRFALSWLRATGCALACLLMLGPGVARAQALRVDLLDAAGAPLADAVVAAVPLDRTVPGASLPPIDIIQRGRQFHPLVSAVRTGSLIRFPNRDGVRHHVYSFSRAKLFELKLYGGTVPEPVLFDKPGTVVLGCNIHDQMLAYVRIVDTPYFGVSDAQGRVNLTVPSGRYRIETWHPAVDLENAADQGVTEVGGGAPAGLRYTLNARR